MASSHVVRQLGLEAPELANSAEKFDLRPYQKECIRDLALYGKDGGRRALVALPTGCGKTVIFSEIAGTASRKVLALAHREELLAQAKDKILRSHPGLVVQIDQAGNRADDYADVVVGSIQTYAVNGNRLRRWRPEDFSVVIVDEAHHATARSYVDVLAHFGLAPDLKKLKSKHKEDMADYFAEFHVAPNAPFLAGFTATPSRTDGQGLEYIFDEIVFSRSIEEMMDDGWLAPVTAIRVQTEADISRVKIRGGDYQESALSKEVNTPERNIVAVNAYRQFAEGRQALVFCVDVEHTNDMLVAFRAGGIKAEMVLGSKRDMEKPREQVIAEYQRGDVQVLINCMVLTEGFDAPETACIIMARPTKSSLLYTQMLGRGTRLAEGKDDLLVIDLVDIAKAGVCSVNTLFGHPPRFDMNGENASRVRKKIQEIEQGMGGAIPMEIYEQAKSIPELKLLAQQVNALASTQIPRWVDASMSWVKTPWGYALNLFGNEQVGIVENMLGKGEIRYKGELGRDELLGQGLLSVYPTPEAGISAVEAWVNRYKSDVAYALNKNASWRSEPPTDKQLDLCQRLRIQIAPGMTKGDVSDLLNKRLAKR